MRMDRLSEAHGRKRGLAGVWLASAFGRDSGVSAAWGHVPGGRGVTGEGAGTTVEGMSKDEEMQ
jgi:hypothetical protein